MDGFREQRIKFLQERPHLFESAHKAFLALRDAGLYSQSTNIKDSIPVVEKLIEDAQNEKRIKPETFSKKLNFNVWLTPEQREHLRKRSFDLGISMSSYAGELINRDMD